MTYRLLALVLPLLCLGCAVAPTAQNPEAGTAPSWSGGLGPVGVYNDTARQSLASGDYGAASSNFEQALRINPFDPVALNNLAVAKAGQGEYHEAQSLLERAAHLAPENLEIAANLARMRAWTRSYALAPSSTLAGGDGSSSGFAPDASRLPPEPPALWTGAPGARP